MTSQPNVVAGEAPESDSDDELNVKDGVAVCGDGTVAKGRVIAGEAPESDEETIGHSGSLGSISSALSASSLPTLSDQKSKRPRKDVSLLTKKLYEGNVSLAKNVTDLVSNTINSANSELNTVDQHLLKCQVQVQEASNILRNLNSKVSQLESKIQSLLSSSYIPEIKIPDREPNAFLKQ